MLRALAPLLILVPALGGASAPVQPRAEPVDVTLARARSEARIADAEVRRLEQVAARAGDEAARLRASQAAAAEAIGAAEARISAADARVRLVAAVAAVRAERLRRAQQPAASLLAGLAMMARRPPLLAILDDGGTEEFVRVRLLLDATLPVIRRRTAALAGEVAEGERLAQAAAGARAGLVESRNELVERRRQFAGLEAAASARAAATGLGAVGAGDLAIALSERAELLSGKAERNRVARRTARELAALGPVPIPLSAAQGPAEQPLAYRLPAEAPVVAGLGEVDPNGIRSRGLTLATRRGADVRVPAAGVIRFAGPFQGYDGVVIIDHGGGWMSLILNVASPLETGVRVAAGERLGRALGELGVELSHEGRHWSPALIAGSSTRLSKRTKGG